MRGLLPALAALVISAAAPCALAQVPSTPAPTPTPFVLPGVIIRGPEIIPSYATPLPAPSGPVMAPVPVLTVPSFSRTIGGSELQRRRVLNTQWVGNLGEQTGVLTGNPLAVVARLRAIYAARTEASRRIVQRGHRLMHVQLRQ